MYLFAGVSVRGITEYGEEWIMVEKALKRIDVEPGIERLEEVTEFVEGTFIECSGSDKVIMSMNIALDEIFSNITYYKYIFLEFQELRYFLYQDYQY